MTPIPGGPPADEKGEIAEFLSTLDIFRGVDSLMLELVAGQTRLVALPQGTVFREDDPSDGLYIIRSGVVKVVKAADRGGGGAVLAVLSRGSCFGEIGLVDGLPRSADVEAMQPTACYFLGRETLISLLEKHPEIAFGMLLALAGMVRNADKWVARSI